MKKFTLLIALMAVSMVLTGTLWAATIADKVASKDTIAKTEALDWDVLGQAAVAVPGQIKDDALTEIAYVPTTNESGITITTADPTDKRVGLYAMATATGPTTAEGMFSRAPGIFSSRSFVVGSYFLAETLPAARGWITYPMNGKTLTRAPAGIVC